MIAASQEEDLRFMRAALTLGQRGQGRTWPNPAVGCLIVKDGLVIGRGVTAPSGRPHAETQALAQAGEGARGATAYVTLEPCNHHGQTPPCSMALIEAGVARVVIAHDDPDPRTAGQGIARLRDAGISVTTDIAAPEAAQAHAGFFMRVTRGRPLVHLKLATTLDGRIATASGESRWITGPEARRMTHVMRGYHDAVMIGAATARADDPDLTLRDIGSPHQPLRVILSRRLDLPRGGRLQASIAKAPLWLVHGQDAPHEACAYWGEAGAHLISLAQSQGGHLELNAALQALGDAGLTSVFCEGGGALAAGLLSVDLVDRLSVFSAGSLIGAEGKPALGALGISELAAAPRFSRLTHRAVGADILSQWSRV